MIYSPNPFKRCTKCKQWFLATPEYFYRQRGCKDGLNPQCKTCVDTRHKRFKAENPDHVHAIQRTAGHAYLERHRNEIHTRRNARRANHPEKARAADRAYYASHQEQERAEARAYWKAHKEHKRAYDHAYQQAHPVKVRAISHRRRAAKLAADGTHTADDITAQYKRQKGRCYYCGKKAKRDGQPYHVDHVFPLSRGGSDAPDNLVIACYKCNLSKHDKRPHEWPEGGRLL